MSASVSNTFLLNYDAIVVGAGAAGLYAALSLPRQLRIALISKETLRTGASDWAQGGIAAAIAPDDATIFHLEDTLKAGAGLCDRPAVKFLVEQAQSAIDALVELGVAFDRDNQKLALTLEAAHSYPRVLHAADTTGRAIVSRLAANVLERKNIRVFSQAFAVQLWLNQQTHHCQGIGLLYQGQLCWLRAAAVILATGGGGQVYAHTTNPPVSTGDGVALAWRAGAQVRDLEFFQFHPTALNQAGAPRFLISEAVRGEGAHLVDEQGQRFAFADHPAGELAPRDVVSRAIFSHLARSDRKSVYLDLRPIAPDRIRHRFPNIIRKCKRWGVDVFSEPIPVAPAAHYWMGGIATDLNARTSVPGLYAIGETASTGVHGANRLASNSLLECLVFAAQLATITSSTQTTSDVTQQKASLLKTSWQTEIAQLQQLRTQLPQLMWQAAGISRSQEDLAKAIAQVESWRQACQPMTLRQTLAQLTPGQTLTFDAPEALEMIRYGAETFNLLDVADLILKSALFRCESRGGHFRSDYPQTRDEWQCHTVIQEGNWQTFPVKR